jgi:RNA recognition motif-containing protein
MSTQHATENGETRMGKRLFVGNLAYSVTEAELRDIFTASGNVTEVKIVLDRDTGRSRGFAFVEMSNETEAKEAISSLNERALSGRPLTVKEAQERTGGGGGGFGGGGHGGRDRDRGGRRDRW